MKISWPDSVNFTLRNTPIQPLNRFFSGHPEYNIWIKRDDLTGLELSGNKVRKLDFLFAEAKAMEANHIMTCGGVQSNHCRAAAFMALKSGMKCTLFLRGEPQVPATGNLFLNQLTSVTIKYVTPEVYQNIDEYMLSYSRSRPIQKDKIYIIPEGGSNALGTWGYIACFSEIIQQIKLYNLGIDVIVVSTGSGGTHAGLLFGKILHSSDLPVISINVCDNAEFFKKKILNIAAEFEVKFGYELNLKKDDIEIIDGYAGAGYGLINARIRKLIRDFVRTEAILLDPVYTAKAFYGLRALIQRGKMDHKNILFVHTGGIFGLFPYATDLI